jgi:hypothetical protein
MDLQHFGKARLHHTLQPAVNIVRIPEQVLFVLGPEPGFSA